MHYFDIELTNDNFDQYITVFNHLEMDNGKVVRRHPTSYMSYLLEHEVIECRGYLGYQILFSYLLIKEGLLATEQVGLRLLFQTFDDLLLFKLSHV